MYEFDTLSNTTKGICVILMITFILGKEFCGTKLPYETELDTEVTL